MIYITGDVHGDAARFTRRAFHRSGHLYPKKGDTVLVCGDFGFLWDDSPKERKLIKKLGKKKFSILFVQGTHENFDLLEKYPAKPFAGGMARKISGNLRCLENGYFFSVEGKQIFAFGGGESEDSLIRLEQGTYDARELPSLETITAAEQRYFAQPIQENNLRADFIITHDAPTRMRNFIHLGNSEMNEMHAFFDRISNEDAFGVWYFGKYHLDRKLSTKFRVLFRDIAVVVPRKKRKRKAGKKS